MTCEPAPSVKPRGFRTLRCAGCGLPSTVCICEAYTPLALPHRLHVVMSRTEARSTSNTARLLRLWLPDSTRLHVVGRPPCSLPPPEASEPSRRATFSSSDGSVLQEIPPASALLFPSRAATCLDQTTPAERHLASLRTLVIVDGTWNQAHKLTRRVLRHIHGRQLQLCSPWPSSYRLRRNARGLCTLEATAIALAHLQAPSQARELLNRFQHWVQLAERVRAGDVLGAGVPPRALAPSRTPSHPALLALEGVRLDQESY